MISNTIVTALILLWVILLLTPPLKYKLKYSNSPKGFYKFFRKKLSNSVIFEFKSILLKDCTSPYIGFMFSNIDWEILYKVYVTEGMNAFTNKYSEYYNVLIPKAKKAVDGYIKDLDTEESQYIDKILNENG